MDLDEGRIRAQLTGGTPPERVAAAWELALRLGAVSAHELRDRLDHESSVGARRHLVVVLAGLGEHDALRAVAEHDDDARVRATAVGMVARTAVPGPDLELWLAGRLSRDPKRELALMVLERSPDHVSLPLSTAIDALSKHEALDVREELVARYERLGAPPSVVDAALRESDPTLRVRLGWLARTHDITALTRLDAETVRSIARRALDRRVSLRWPEVAAFATRPAIGYADSALVLAAVFDHDEIPLSSLLVLASESWASPAKMEPILARCEREHLTDVDRALLARWCDGLRPSRADVEYDPADDSYPPDPIEVAYVGSLIARVDARLARR